MGVLETSPRGRRVIVTGAAGGIGRAVVDALAAGGNRIGVADLVETAELFRDVPAVVARAAFDLTDAAATREGIAALVEGLGGCDAIVANAGVVDTIRRAEAFRDEAWRKDIDTNLTGQFVAIQATFPALEASGDGRVVVISSGAAESGLPGQVAYAASKAGLLGMVRTLASEWADRGIRANAILPGLIETPKVKALPPEMKERILRGILLGRFGLPEEIAGTVAFLLSPAAAYLTGTTIAVQGGWGGIRGILGSDS